MFDQYAEIRAQLVALRTLANLAIDHLATETLDDWEKVKEEVSQTREFR
jgi:hypothetical protein